MSIDVNNSGSVTLRGDGSDGDVVLNGHEVPFANMLRTSDGYDVVYTLTRNLQAERLTIGHRVLLQSNGYRIQYRRLHMSPEAGLR